MREDLKILQAILKPLMDKVYKHRFSTIDGHISFDAQTHRCYKSYNIHVLLKHDKIIVNVKIKNVKIETNILEDNNLDISSWYDGTWKESEFILAEPDSIEKINKALNNFWDEQERRAPMESTNNRIADLKYTYEALRRKPSTKLKTEDVIDTLSMAIDVIESLKSQLKEVCLERRDTLGMAIDVIEALKSQSEVREKSS